MLLQFLAACCGGDQQKKCLPFAFLSHPRLSVTTQRGFGFGAFVLGFRVRNALLSRGSDQPLHNPPVESGRLKAHPKVALMSDRNPIKCESEPEAPKENLSSLDEPLE